MKYTNNLSLPQFEPTDYFDINDFNTSFKTIDENIKTLQDTMIDAGGGSVATTFEVVESRKDANNGTQFNSLKERLDSNYSQLDGKINNVNMIVNNNLPTMNDKIDNNLNKINSINSNIDSIDLELVGVSEDITTINNNINKTNTTISNLIQTGNDGNWYWTKLADGTVYLKRRMNLGNVTLAYNQTSNMNLGACSMDYPFTLAGAKPSVLCSMESSAFMTACQPAQSSTNTNLQISFGCTYTTSLVNVFVNVFVIGRWK